MTWRTISILLMFLLTILTLAIQPSKAAGQSLIQSGTVEISTISAYPGSNILGLGVGFSKSGGSSILTLGMDIGYFLTSFAEIGGGLALIRESYSDSYGDYDFSESYTTSVVTGTLALNFANSQSSFIPYVIGGASMMNFEDDSEMLIKLGGGVKIPIKIINNLAVRIEYSYNQSSAEDSEGLHSVSLAFSVFFNTRP